MPDENNVSRETEQDEQQPATKNAAGATDTEQPADELTEVSDSQHDENSGDENNVSRETSESEEPAERSEVGKLRRESANYRTRLRESEQRADALARELVAARIRESGRLADPTDLDPDPALLEDGALDAAIDELIERKPHLKARSFGNVGQHEHSTADGVSLGSLLRNNV